MGQRGPVGGGRTPPRPKGMPKMPTWLPAEAQAEWRRVLPILKEMGTVSAADQSIIASYCLAVADLQIASEILDRDGMTVPGEGSLRPHPACGIQRHAMHAIRILGGELGLSPMSRGRLRVPHEEPVAMVETRPRVFSLTDEHN